MPNLEHLSLAELAEVEADIRAAKRKVTTREVKRIAAEAKALGYSLGDLIGKKAARRAKGAQIHVR